MNENLITFQQVMRQIEQAIIMERIHREGFADQPFELMVTFNPHVQITIDTFAEPGQMYGPKYERRIFGVPWFSDMSQEEPFKVWSHAIPQTN